MAVLDRAASTNRAAKGSQSHCQRPCRCHRCHCLVVIIIIGHMNPPPPAFLKICGKGFFFNTSLPMKKNGQNGLKCKGCHLGRCLKPFLSLRAVDCTSKNAVTHSPCFPDRTMKCFWPFNQMDSLLQKWVAK